MTDIPSEVFRYLSDDDVPEDLVDRVLSKLRETPDFIRFSQTDWNQLRDRKPNLHHFIEAASNEAAPDDPLQREKISAALLGLVYLDHESELVHGEAGIAKMLQGEFGNSFEVALKENDEPQPPEQHQIT